MRPRFRRPPPARPLMAMGRNGVIPGEIGTTAELAEELTALSRALGVAIVAARSLAELKDTRRIMMERFQEEPS